VQGLIVDAEDFEVCAARNAGELSVSAVAVHSEGEVATVAVHEVKVGDHEGACDQRR
jgi:hypothetical protein